LAFSVIRVPFFLEPNYDPSKPYIESNRERLVKKWGGKRGWETQKNHHNLKGRGMDAGIPHFNLDRLAANSMASHRLIQHLGKTYGLGVSETIYDLLNQYYFVDGHSLNDRPLLARAVAEALSSMMEDAPSARELLDFLDGDQGRKEIEAALRALDQLGVHSIPKFIIEGRTLLDGAAHSDSFIQIFREIEARGKVHAGTKFADILGIPPKIVEQGSHHRPSNIAA
jgi:predicted DsbA family dithiol-disulfide isomerase